MNKEIILEIVKLLIMILAAVLTRYVIPWIRHKTQNEVFHNVIDWIMQAVLAAEQAYSAQTGAERKAIVTEFIKQILREKNIALSDSELDMLIESAVKQMNDGAY